MTTAALRRLLVGCAVLAVALLVAGPATSAWKAQRATAASERLCHANAAQAAARNARIDNGGTRRIAVLGDSYSAGYGLTDLKQSWPSLIAKPLHARISVQSLGGTGYVATPCGPHDTFADRAAAVRVTHPDMVIVEGGLNDVRASSAAIRTGAGRTLSRLGGTEVVLVGPTAAPNMIIEAKRVDRVLAAFAAAHRIRYVSAYAWRIEFSADGVHPTAAGYRSFAHHVAAALS